MAHESSHTERAEFSVLAAMLLGQDPVTEALELLESTDFAWRQHAVVFEAVQSLFDKGSPVDPVTLMAELQSRGRMDDAGGVEYIGELIGGVPTGDNVGWHCKLVKEEAARRRLATVCQTAIRDLEEVGGGSVEDILEKTEKGIFEITHNVAVGEPQSVSSLIAAKVAKINEQHKSGVELFGIPSGMKFLDHYTGGFQNGELYVLAARPSMGKTALALNIIDYVGTVREEPVVLFSLEMTTEAVLERLLSLRTGIDAQKLKNPNRLRADDPLQLNRQSKILDKAEIYIDDQPGSTILAMRAKARRAMGKHKFKLLVVDYLQLMYGPKNSSNRNEEVSYISRGLKALARELNVPVLALSQLSRGPEQRDNKRPLLSDLRDSGSIEQDADVVLFLYRPSYYFATDPKTDQPTEGKAELHLAKNRNGPTGTIHMMFRDRTMKFHETHTE